MPAITRAALVSLACSFLFVMPALSAGHPDKSGRPDKPDRTKGASRATAEVRKLQFPDKSVGALMLITERPGDDHWFTYSQGIQVGSAQGNVSITVPPDHVLMMDANRRIFENPILLKEVSPGLDVLRLSFMPMADCEDHMLERAMPFVENLKGLRALFFDRSDASDLEVSKLKSLPHLCYISFFLSRVDGSCFKTLSAFPELYQLDVPCCHIDQKNIAYLAQIRKLKYLDLDRTGMTIVGARSLSKLTTLVRLDLGQNPKLDDECVKCLQPLKKLYWLDLQSTKVTFEGIKYLRDLKLHQLVVPANCRSHMSEIKAMFPSTIIQLEMGHEKIDREDKIIYGPLK